MVKRHWEKFQPWPEAVYVPVGILAGCVDKGNGLVRVDIGMVPYNDAFILEGWHRCGKVLDGYILRQPGGLFSIGVRYGPNGEDYISCLPDQKRTAEVYDQYS